jgi:D-3-phosphoglycerate dehydrogenase
LLALARKVAFYHYETKLGRYDLQDGPALKRIEGQTLGIVGFGGIGRKLAEKATAIGVNVLATGRTRKHPSEFPDGVTWCDLDDLLVHSDYVSLHVPLTAESTHLIGAEQLARMKPSAYLINTARGGLIDHTALAAAINAGQLAGAALDVQDPEPPDLTQPPYNDPRVIVTPHSAFVSVESLRALRTRAARQVATCLLGGEPDHIVNPDAIGRARPANNNGSQHAIRSQTA